MPREGNPRRTSSTLSSDDGTQLRLQHLERHLAVVLQVLGQVHRRHAAFTEPTLALNIPREAPKSKRFRGVPIRI